MSVVSALPVLVASIVPGNEQHRCKWLEVSSLLHYALLLSAWMTSLKVFILSHVPLWGYENPAKVLTEPNKQVSTTIGITLIILINLKNSDQNTVFKRYCPAFVLTQAEAQCACPISHGTTVKTNVCQKEKSYVFISL